MSELHSRAIARVSEYLTGFLADPKGFRGQQLRGGGPVADFENALAARCGFPFCLATSSATSALLITALAAALPYRKIIMPPNGWGGTYGPFEAADAVLVKAAADGDGNICPKSILSLAINNPAAVVATDWNGVRHDTKEVRAVCDSIGALYIEDTAWLPGFTGPLHDYALADIQILSFGPGKPMSLGEGGAILLRTYDLYERAVALSQHPERALREQIAQYPAHPFLNGRIHPLAAIIGSALLT